MPPSENNDLLKHPQIKNLVNYAKKVEGDNFDKADSRVVILVMMIMMVPVNLMWFILGFICRNDDVTSFLI